MDNNIIKKGTMVHVWTISFSNYGEHHYSYEYELKQDTPSQIIWDEAAHTAQWEAESQFSDSFDYGVEFKELAS